jgi:KDO2-lipid IV(A) lauroyltransferase
MNLPERIADLTYGAGWRLGRLLPAGVAHGLFRTAADIQAHRGKAAAQQLRQNLARVVPQAGEAELDDLVREGLRSYARYWCEAFRLPSTDRTKVVAQVDETITGTEYLDAALADKRGAVVALPHSGNFDVAGVWAVHHYGSFTTVNQRIKPESLFEKFVAYRESLGFEILPLTGGDRPASMVLAERLRENRIICLLADRDLTRAGLPVTFFGEPTRMPAGPAKLAEMTGAALLPLGCWFTDGGWGFRIHPPITVTGQDGVHAATQAMADVFAGDIAAHPADWHMTQQLWLADLPERHQKILANAAARENRAGP